MIFNARIAPTPSGFLHPGNAYNFLLTERLTAAAGGTLRLRIDDMDRPRVQPEFVQDIFDTLQWLGIQWNLGPKNPSEQHTVFSQRLRIHLYEKMLARLVDTGLVFACTCSRSKITAHSADGQYPGTCRDKALPLDTPDAGWRIKTPEDCVIFFEDKLVGETSLNLYDANRDFIIRRRDGFPAYHVASLADDLLYEISCIVRGEDLLASTAAQLYLARLLNERSFANANFYHHPLLVDAAGEKLSKSSGSQSLKAMRENGLPAVALREDFERWAADR